MNDRPPGYVSHEQAVAELTRALNEVSRQGRTYLCPSCGVRVRSGHLEDHGPHDIDASDGSQETIAT